ncbi:hypothetical protein DYH09_00920 [bacterium CPR1]|nr:hypothetical protein [bacterium CPR1]
MIQYELGSGAPLLRPQAPSGRFQWARGGTYAWVSRHDGIGGEAPFLAEVEPSRQAYSPSPRLHRTFAALANHNPARTLEAIEKFAKRYGPLGVAQLIPPDPRVGRMAPFLPRHAGQALAEPLGRWWRQAREMRNLLGLAEAVGHPERLAGMVRWGQMSYHPAGTTIKGEQNRAFLCVRHSAFKPPGEAFSLQETDCDLIEGEFASRDNLEAVLAYLAGQLDSALSLWVEVRASCSGGKLRVQRWPRNLLGWMWLGLADELAANLPTAHRCNRCGSLTVERGHKCLNS